MADVIVRARSPADLDQCVDVLRAVHAADAYPLNWPADPCAWLTPPRLLAAWVAEDPHRVILGHVAVQHVSDGGQDRGESGPWVELSRLFVTPPARRSSVATALVRQARSWAAEQGYRITLNVTDEHRSAAVAFYEATGWRHSHTRDADWTTPDGRSVRLRHYGLDGQERRRSRNTP